MAGTPEAFSSTAFTDAFQTGSAAAESVPTYGGGHGDDYERRVRNWWDEIDRLRAENREREAAAAEKLRRAEELDAEARRLEAKRIAKRARKAQEARAGELKRLRAETYAAESEALRLRVAIEDASAEIVRIQDEIAATEAAAVRAAFMARRNAALALLLLT